MRQIAETIAAEDLNQVHEQNRADHSENAEQLRVDRHVPRKPIEREQAGAKNDGEIAGRDNRGGDSHGNRRRAGMAHFRYRLADRTVRGVIAQRIAFTRHTHRSNKARPVVFFIDPPATRSCPSHRWSSWWWQDSPRALAAAGVTLLSVVVTFLGPSGERAGVGDAAEDQR